MGCVPIVEFLTPRGSNRNWPDKYSMSPLNLVVVMDDLLVVTLLVDQGAMLNKPDNNALTPLHWAIIGPTRLPIATFLADRGDNLNILDKAVRSPMYLACAGGHLPFVEFLAERGVDLDTRSCSLHRASSSPRRHADQIRQWKFICRRPTIPFDRYP
jgi:ankyrin repeat protein